MYEELRNDVIEFMHMLFRSADARNMPALLLIATYMNMYNGSIVVHM